ncbi:hypothetical protein NFI96_017952, partial [Prochilodus magdalenae]
MKLQGEEMKVKFQFLDNSKPVPPPLPVCLGEWETLKAEDRAAGAEEFSGAIQVSVRVKKWREFVLLAFQVSSTITCQNDGDCSELKTRSEYAQSSPSAQMGTCLVMGDSHYRTFDGNYYNFMGNCTYIIARNCYVDSKHPEFEVQTKKELNGNTQETVVTVVTTAVYGNTITFIRNMKGLVMVNNMLWKLPISLSHGRVKVQPNGLSVTIQTDFGLSVQYDWNEFLVVTVSDSFLGRMGGMCGNFTGTQDVHLTTSSGSLAGNISALGKSWRVPGSPEDAFCSDGCVGQCQSCEQASWFQQMKAKFFCRIVTALTKGPLQECNSVIDPSIFYDTCLYDFCAGKDMKNFLCYASEMYCDACERAGIRVHNWRRLLDCRAPSCPENSHFESCACPATCANPTPSAECKANCSEACVCNNGYLWSGNQCVPKNQCGCIYSSGGEERYLQAGESIWADNTCSKRCTCEGNCNEVVCIAASCPIGSGCSVVNGTRDCHSYGQATCNIYGDPHYNTFDNSTFDFQGTCTYTAAQGCHLEGTQLTPFAVVVENERWDEIQLTPNVSMAKVVVVEVYALTLVLQRNQLHQITINGVLNNIPVSLDNGKVTVQQEGFQNVIATDFGLRVAYDMVYHVSITVPSNYRGKTCGLCGNYNGNRNDDFMLPDGKQTKDLKTFTAAWKVAVPGIVCDDGCTGDVCPQCPANKKAIFEKDCSIITNPQGPFAACHNVINPESYFRDCVFDVCMGDGDGKMLCHSIAAYMIDCQDFGITVQNWRTPSFCPLQCPANSHYEICAQSCSTPCPGLTSVISCTFQTCAEGCMCDSGFFTNGTGCVKADQCSCYENGHTYKIGESLITDDCHERLTCLPSGEVKNESIGCQSNEVCQVKNGVRGCYRRQCLLEAGGSFTLFNGESWTITSTGAYDLVKLCNGTSDEWFRVVAQLEACDQNSVAFVYVFLNDIFISVNSKQSTWVNGKPVTLPQQLMNETAVQWSNNTVIIEMESVITVSYSLSQGVSVTVSEEWADK